MCCLSACGADHHNPSCLSAWAAKELVADEGPDVGGAGDVQNRQQGDQAGEGSHSRLHGWIQVCFHVCFF